MPTYEYSCDACAEHVEVVQSFRDDPLTTCSNCGGHLRKVFGNIGIVFKGSGFYKNDSRKAGSSSSTPKPDAKPDAKPDGKGDAAEKASKTPETPAAKSAPTDRTGGAVA